VPENTPRRDRSLQPAMLTAHRVADRLRGSFWFVPALCALGAVVMALGLLFADRHIEPRGLRGWLYAGSAEGARALLAALAGAVITVLGLAFSITTVALQLAAAQLGPRLLRNFVRDPGNQIVLGTLVGTFVYCLVVLRSIHGGSGATREAFVPELSVAGAVALGLLSVGVLIYFIHHAAVSMQADRVIAAVAAELDAVIESLARGDGDGEQDATLAATAPPTADEVAIRSHGSGYVQSIDVEGLVGLAARHDLVVRLRVRPGDFLADDDVLAWSGPAARVTTAVRAAIARTLVLGIERTMLQDVLFGIEQLVEIALNALSSNGRDPITATRCVDRLGAAVGRMADRSMRSPVQRDGDGRVRVLLRTVALDELVGTAFDAVRAHGRPHRLVSVRLLETFTRLVGRQRRAPALDQALLEQAVAVLRGSDALADPLDRAAVHRAFQAFAHAFGDDATVLGAVERPTIAPAA
jgi:uncharacterized membrane protein